MHPPKIEHGARKREDTATADLLKVLIVDGDIVDFETMQRALNAMESYEVDAIWAKNPEKARYYLKNGDYDIVFIHFNQRVDRAAALIQDIGGRVSPHVPILITPHANNEVQRMALAAGAIHCLRKDDLDARLLETTIRYALFTHALEKRLYTQLMSDRHVQQEAELQMTEMAIELEKRAFDLQLTSQILSQLSVSGDAFDVVQRQSGKLIAHGQALNNLAATITNHHERAATAEKQGAATQPATPSHVIELSKLRNQSGAA